MDKKRYINEHLWLTYIGTILVIKRSSKFFYFCTKTFIELTASKNNKLRKMYWSCAQQKKNSRYLN